VHKKIAEFLGEPEEALMTLVLELSVAEPVLEELELALEDDAMTQCAVVLVDAQSKYLYN
jgi:hypothetical protein